VRKDEAHRFGELELGHDRLEVVPVRAEAVQPDDRGFRIRTGVDFYSFHY
jgi:hypothetical protein